MHLAIALRLALLRQHFLSVAKTLNFMQHVATFLHLFPAAFPRRYGFIYDETGWHNGRAVCPIPHRN